MEEPYGSKQKSSQTPRAVGMRGSGRRFSRRGYVEVPLRCSYCTMCCLYQHGGNKTPSESLETPALGHFGRTERGKRVYITPCPVRNVQDDIDRVWY